MAALARSRGSRCGTRARSKGGPDSANLDVAVCDLRIGAVLLNVIRRTRGSGASSTRETGGRRVLVGRVSRVEPEHIDGMVVPDGQRQHHTAADGTAHGVEPTRLLKAVVVASL